MTALEFTVSLPPRALSPNTSRSSARWHKQSHVKAYRQYVAALGRLAKPRWKAPARAKLTLMFCLKDDAGTLGRIQRSQFYHPRDQDNALASFKAGLDGIRDAGLIRGDEWDAVQIVVAMTKERGPFVEVQIEAVQ